MVPTRGISSHQQTLDEEDDAELHLAISRTRRIKQQEESSASRVKSEEEMETFELSVHQSNNQSTDVYLDETSEFCRAVGAGSGPSTRAVVKEEKVIVQPDYQDEMDMEIDEDMDRDYDDDRERQTQDAKGGWNEVQFEVEPANLGSDEEGDGQPGGRKPSSSKGKHPGKRVGT